MTVRELGTQLHGLTIVAAQGAKARPLLEVSLLGGYANLCLLQMRKLVPEVCVNVQSASGSGSSSASCPVTVATDAMSVEECISALAK